MCRHYTDSPPSIQGGKVINCTGIKGSIIMYIYGIQYGRLRRHLGRFRTDNNQSVTWGTLNSSEKLSIFKLGFLTVPYRDLVWFRLGLVQKIGAICSDLQEKNLSKAFLTQLSADFHVFSARCFQNIFNKTTITSATHTISSNQLSILNL